MTEDLFLQTIFENLHDENPRLVFADWLEENGHTSRAEMIRVGSKLAKWPKGHSKRVKPMLRERALLKDHQGEWVQHCGIWMTWDNLLSLFRRRLAETVAWCRGLPSHALRPPARRHASFLGRFTLPTRRQAYPAPTNVKRQEAVNSLANERVSLLSEEERHLWNQVGGTGGGRLLLHDPDALYREDADPTPCDDYFDSDGLPIRDSWVFYIEERESRNGGRRRFDSYLVSWVPPRRIDGVHRRIRHDTDWTISWATALDTAFTRKLKSAGLLA